MNNLARLLGTFWAQIKGGLASDLIKLWPSATFLAAVSIINSLGLTKPILVLHGEYLKNGELFYDMTVWYNGILILAALAWLLILGAHIVQDKEYQIVHGDIVDTHHGNANWISGVLIIIGGITFLILGAPVIPIILFTALTFLFFAGQKRFHEQGLYELPKLANLVLVALAVWQIAIG